MPLRHVYVLVEYLRVRCNATFFFTPHRAQLSMNVSCVRNDVSGEDQSGGGDSDRAKRPDHPSSGITAGPGIAPAAASALKPRRVLDTLPRATANAIRKSDAATVARCLDLRERTLS